METTRFPYLSILIVASILLLLPGPALAGGDTLPEKEKDQIGRLTVFISDLHWGIGSGPDGNWNPKEDFRWTWAIAGFLDRISSEGNDAVDLVILGDLLELWQPPEGVGCTGTGPELGCTIEEMRRIVGAVIDAHKHDFKALRNFCQRGSNRIYIIPGNHDAALVLPEIWQSVADAFHTETGRVTLLKEGFWESMNGRLVAEHGHQIGFDVNRYENWPVITQEVCGETYIIRPWGERFVQRIFNDEETRYPLIDNVSPETVGVRYLMADRGLMGSAEDIARFISFQLFETSFSQKLAFLGRPSESNADYADNWSRVNAERMGHRLFLESLDKADPFRQFLEEDRAEAVSIRKELDRLTKTLSDDELQMLCITASKGKSIDPCKATLGRTLQSIFIAKSTVMKGHLTERMKRFPKMVAFIYGHTHLCEPPWNVKLRNGRNILVLNSGAFQRLVDEKGFEGRARSFENPLAEIPLGELAPCYTAVVVDPASRVPKPKLRVWHMPKGEPGRWVSPGSDLCR